MFSMVSYKEMDLDNEDSGSATISYAEEDLANFNSCRFDFRIDTKNGLTPSRRKKSERKGNNGFNTFLKCKVCGQLFDSRPALLSHKATHVNKTEYVCPICKIKVNRKASLKEHLEYVHQSGLDGKPLNPENMGSQEEEKKMTKKELMGVMRWLVESRQERKSASATDTTGDVKNIEPMEKHPSSINNASVKSKSQSKSMTATIAELLHEKSPSHDVSSSTALPPSEDNMILQPQDQQADALTSTPQNYVCINVPIYIGNSNQHNPNESQITSVPSLMNTYSTSSSTASHNAATMIPQQTKPLVSTVSSVMDHVNKTENAQKKASLHKKVPPLVVPIAPPRNPFPPSKPTYQTLPAEPLSYPNKLPSPSLPALIKEEDLEPGEVRTLALGNDPLNMNSSSNYSLFDIDSQKHSPSGVSALVKNPMVMLGGGDTSRPGSASLQPISVQSTMSGMSDWNQEWFNEDEPQDLSLKPKKEVGFVDQNVEDEVMDLSLKRPSDQNKLESEQPSKKKKGLHSIMEKLWKNKNGDKVRDIPKIEEREESNEGSILSSMPPLLSPTLIPSSGFAPSHTPVLTPASIWPQQTPMGVITQEQVAALGAQTGVLQSPIIQIIPVSQATPQTPIDALIPQLQMTNTQVMLPNPSVLSKLKQSTAVLDESSPSGNDKQRKLLPKSQSLHKIERQVEESLCQEAETLPEEVAGSEKCTSNKGEFLTFHTCRICKELFSDRKDLLEHSKIHTWQGKKPIKCIACDYTAANTMPLLKHSFAAHDRHIYQRLAEQLTTTNPFVPNEGGEGLKCTLCDRVATQLKDYVRHTACFSKKRISFSKTPTSITKCCYCNETFNTREQATVHHSVHHIADLALLSSLNEKESNPQTSESIDLSFDDLDAAVEQAEIEMEQQAWLSNNGTENGPVPADQYGNDDHLDDDVVITGDEVPSRSTAAGVFKCSECQDSFTSQPFLWRHMRTKHIDSLRARQMDCPYEDCYRVFYDDNSLQCHIKSHGGATLLCRVPQCNKMFHIGKVFQEHKAEHKKDGGNLRSKKKARKPSNPKAASSEGKSYKFHNVMFSNNGQSSATGWPDGWPFKCPFCNYSGRQAYLLYLHATKAHTLDADQMEILKKQVQDISSKTSTGMEFNMPDTNKSKDDMLDIHSESAKVEQIDDTNIDNSVNFITQPSLPCFPQPEPEYIEDDLPGKLDQKDDQIESKEYRPIVIEPIEENERSNRESESQICEKLLKDNGHIDQDSPDESDLTKYMCPYSGCDVKFDSKQEIRTHMIDVHAAVSSNTMLTHNLLQEIDAMK